MNSYCFSKEVNFLDNVECFLSKICRQIELYFDVKVSPIIANSHDIDVHFEIEDILIQIKIIKTNSHMNTVIQIKFIKQKILPEDLKMYRKLCD